MEFRGRARARVVATSAWPVVLVVLTVIATAGEVPLHPLAAPAEPPLSIAQLEQMALAYHPALALSARRIEALQGKQLQVGLHPNPTIGYQGEEIGEDGRAGQQGMMLQQRIVTGGKLGWNRTVVTREIAAAQQQWEIQRYRVIGDVRAAAHQVVAAQRTVVLAEHLVQVAEEFLRAAQQLFAAQEVSRIDVLQARMEANAGALRLERARQSLAGHWHQLVAQMGVPDLPPTPIEDAWDELDLPPIGWDEAIVRLLGESPEWRRAFAEIERAEAELASQCAARFPDLEMHGGVAYNFASGNTLAAAGVALPLQLFDRNQGNIQRARAELSGAHEDLRRVELILHQRLAVELETYTNSRSTVIRYRDAILPDAGQLLDLVRAAYRQGEIGYLELLTVQQTYYQTHLGLVEAFRDLQVSRTRIDTLLASGALDEPF